MDSGNDAPSRSAQSPNRADFRSWTSARNRSVPAVLGPSGPVRAGRLGQPGDRSVEILLAEANPGEVDVGVEPIGNEPDGLLEVGGSLVQPGTPKPHEPPVEVEGVAEPVVGGIEPGQGLAEVFLGGLEVGGVGSRGFGAGQPLVEGGVEARRILPPAGSRRVPS